MDLEILKIAAKAKRKKVKNQKQILKNYRNDLVEIEKKYSFLSFNFRDKLGWDLSYFVKLVYEKLGSDISKKIRSIKNYNKNTAREFNELVKKLKLLRHEKKICELIRNLGYYKWAREYEVQEAMYNLKFIQDEIGRRLGLSTLENKYLLSGEYRLAFIQSVKYKKIAKARIKNSLNIVKANGETKMFTGRMARQAFLKMSIVEVNKNSKIKELTGMPSYSGRVQGIVKIINTFKDAKKMMRGNILVSQATSPDLLPAMKQATAIVTNEGGITSHAAIVSRELKIPCIVGTKIATKILHDGDLVEVDADMGVVKIIKKEK